MVQGCLDGLRLVVKHPMRDWLYLRKVTTFTLNVDQCSGFRTCALVGPHGVLEIEARKALIGGRDRCMECRACARNCPREALAVAPA